MIATVMAFFGGLKLPWLKIAAVLAVVALLGGGYMKIHGWFQNNKHTLAVQADTIKDQTGQITRLTDAVRVAEANLLAAKATFEQTLNQMKGDMAALAADRNAALKRAKSFDALRREIANATPDETGVASVVLIRAVDGVRVRIRGREAAETGDRVSDAGRESGPAHPS